MTMRIGRSASAADDVAEETHAVLVGPLQVVEEDRQRADRGELGDRDGGEVIGAQQLLRGRQLRERWIVTSRQRVDRATHRRLGGGRPGRDLLDLAATQEGPGEHERPSQLLVRGQRERSEALALGELARGHEEACLADAGLALDAHAGQPAPGRRRQLLADRGHLGRPADQLLVRAKRLHGERTERTLRPIG